MAQIIDGVVLAKPLYTLPTDLSSVDSRAKIYIEIGEDVSLNTFSKLINPYPHLKVHIHIKPDKAGAKEVGVGLYEIDEVEFTYDELEEINGTKVTAFHQVYSTAQGNEEDYLDKTGNKIQEGEEALSYNEKYKNIIFYASDTKKVYLNGELYGGGDETLKEDIQIAGGPLANNISETNDTWPEDWKDNAGNKIIPQGKSLEEILTGLFLKVINGTVSKGSITWNPTLSAPTASISVSGTVEVGTKLTANAGTTNTVSGNTRSCTFTCNPGHFISTGRDDDGKLVFGPYVSGNKTVYANAADPATSGTPTIKTYWNDKEVDLNETNECIVSIVGTNTFKVDQSGITAYAGAINDITVYGSTNTKVPIETVNASIEADTAPDAKPLASTISKIVTGARYMFWGAHAEHKTLNSAIIREHVNGGTIASQAKTVTITIPESGVNQFYVAFPSNRKLTKVYNTAAGEQFGEVTDSFTSSTIAVDGAEGYTSDNYTVWTFNSGTSWVGPNTLTVIIG